MKQALIAGGTSGVGYSILNALLNTKFKVYFIGSNEEKGVAVESEMNRRHPGMAKFINLDLSNLKAVKEFAREFADENDSLYVLANIAGVMIPNRVTTKEGFEKTFAVGYLSAFILSTELTPLLEKVRGRIVNVGGVPSFVFKARLDFEDISFTKGYNSFKTAITTVHAKTVLTEILSEKYASRGIDVNSFHPGAVRSDLMNNTSKFQRLIFEFLSIFMTKESRTGIYVCSSPEIKGLSGKFFVKTKPRDLCFDNKYKEKLWKLSEKLISSI